MTATVSYANAVVRGTSGYSGLPNISKLSSWAEGKGISQRHVFAIAKNIRARGTVGESGNITGNSRYDGGPQDWLSEALKEASK